MNEKELERLFSQDFSGGTEAFRDALLERCLDELRDSDHSVELEDEDLEMLAAAGDFALLGNKDFG